jgi:cytochrome c553
MKMKPLRALLAAAALPLLAALAGCNKPSEVSSPMQAASATNPTGTPASGAAAASAGEASAPSAASAGAAASGNGLNAAGGSGTGSGALAAVPVASLPQPTDAQRQAGAQIAAKGAGSAAACASCHGAHGEGNAASGFPRIAGQSYAYLLHQLDSYAGGARQNPVMAPIAKALAEAQREQAAAYYASLSPTGAAGPAAAGAAGTGASGNGAGAASRASGNDRGRQLAIAGDERKFVQACVNCHGPMGAGEGSAYPYLGGQHQSYLVNALKEWRDGSRNTDPSGQMPVIAKSMSEDEATAVAAYYAAQPLPDRPRDAAVSALTAQQPGAPASAVQSGPRHAGSSTGMQGNGTEQGAPTTGGSQGPGGGGGGSGSGSSGSPTGAGQTGTGNPQGSGAAASGAAH